MYGVDMSTSIKVLNFGKNKNLGLVPILLWDCMFDAGVRAIDALASDKNLMAKTGKIFVDAQLATEYGFTDIDGKLPLPLTLETS
jgi:hypothetical protein